MRIKVGTRGSSLALRQADFMIRLLQDRFPAIAFSLEVVRTEGDRVQDRPISQIGDKGIFVRAIERALTAGSVDLAVHSLKDVPSDVEAPGLCLAAFSPREDPRDVLVSRSGQTVESLPPGARVGTSSVRRKVQLLNLRPDLVAADIRGNVDTRLRKLEAGDYDAILLAAAGLHRLGLAHRITQYLSVERFVPDAGQGILAVQAQVDAQAARLAQAIDDRASHLAALAERSVVQGLGAGCHSPIGAYAMVDAERIRIRAMAANEDGSIVRREQAEGSVEEAEALGRELGARLLEFVRV